MTTTTKLALLELVDELFGWGWIIFGILTLFFFVKALAFDGTWSPFLWTLGGSIICNGLLRGILYIRKRVAYEAKLVEQGFPPRRSSRRSP